ncbi:hypothetical protein J4573_48615 [Actinomadura barringtoniae]|uniref:DUF4760 domain-containing protein n=1 Tax=Actinomadura barringtoniae TaxID=1427535 RepID=A0A939PLW5_9ACTN|nr:hypothetical protein [Actinomadura barringtoniae]MBO2455025.1 hypothetical protein [Actinomadura barringtoniae]
MNAALAAVVAAITSVTVAVLSLLLGERQQRRKEERVRRQDLNAQYLNPLRLHLVENHFRLSGTFERTSEAGQAEAMLVIDDPAEVSGKDAAWFNGRGCALVSSVYLTACLFAHLKKVRDDFPYLRLPAADDTQLAALLLRVQRGFLRDQGVYYVTQPSIGESMWLRDEKRLLTYREFCERLQDPAWRTWLDRLIQFQLDTAQGDRQERTQQLLKALEQLSEFLDECVGGGRSIESRRQAENTDLS